jgi:hypothetical protein
MLTLIILDAVADMSKRMVFSEGRKEFDEEREDVEEGREDVEKEEKAGVRKESLELVPDVRAGGSGYTSLAFSGASRRAI